MTLANLSAPNVCDHLEETCKAGGRAWESWRFCGDCRTWFWYGKNLYNTDRRFIIIERKQNISY